MNIGKKFMLLEETDDYLVFFFFKTKVTEADGRSWNTKEPAILYFYKNRWFNIIGQFKKDGVYYYCNIASPYIIEDGAIKYIDYDLDLRVFPNGNYRVLDKGEYKYHKEKMNYPEEIDTILKRELDELIEMKKQEIHPFNLEEITDYKKKYNNLQKIS